MVLPEQESLPILETTEKPISEAVEKELPPLGLTAGIDDETYHRGPGISKSGLDLIARSPLHYITAKRHPKPDSPTFRIGKPFHCLVLEPDTFPEKYILVPPDAPSRPTARQINAKKPSPATVQAIAYWEAWDAENGDKVALTNKVGTAGEFWAPGEWDQVHRMADAVREHPVASILFEQGSGQAEMSGYWIDRETGKLCKIRPDFLNDAHNVCVDLKSTGDASYTGAGKSCGEYRYYVQDAYYTDGLRECDRSIIAFIFVFVEKAPPYGVGVYTLSREAKQIGREVYRRNLDTYAKYQKADEWPCYPPEIRDLDIPKWGLMERIG